MTRLSIFGILTCYAIALWPGMPVHAAESPSAGNGQVLQTVVVEATAIPGSAVDADKIPGNV